MVCCAGEGARVNQAKGWKLAGLGAVLALAVAAPPALRTVRAAPDPVPASPPPAAAQPQKTLGRICKADEIVDPRPAPKWVGASFAGDNCQAPPLPAALDGSTASREQVVAAMAAAKRYAVLADAYQRCISDFVAGRARHDAPLAIIENHRILVSQENKKLAARRVEVAINAFNEYGSNCPDQ